MSRDPAARLTRTWMSRPWSTASYFAPPIGIAACAVIAGGIYTLGLGLLAGAAVGAAIALTAFVSVAGERFCEVARISVITAGACAGLFVTVGATRLPWTGDGPAVAAVILTVAALVASFGWRQVKDAQDAHELARWMKISQQRNTAAPALSAAPAAPRRSETALKWEKWFSSYGKEGVAFIGSRKDKVGNEIIHMRLPATGKLRFEDVQALEGNLEVWLPGVAAGAVQITRARDNSNRWSSTDFLVRIDYVDILEQTIWLDENDTKPRSVKEALIIAFYADGTPMYMPTQEIHWLIIALSRCGKTNLLNVILFRLAHCYDAVVWAGDGKGRFVPGWIKAFTDRAVHPRTKQPLSRPVIDWACVDTWELIRMLRAALDIAQSRPFAALGGSKTVISEQNPHIFVVIDEVTTFLDANHEVADLIKALAAKGAGEGVTLVICSQRGTVTAAGPGDALANISGRIGLGFQDAQDAAQVFPKAGDMARLATKFIHKGCAVIGTSTSADVPLAGKVLFMGDNDELDRRIYQAAISGSEIVPGLMEGTLGYEVACRHGYADRWEDTRRMGWAIGMARGPWQGLSFEDVERAERDRRFEELAAKGKDFFPEMPHQAARRRVSEQFEDMVGAADWSDVEAGAAEAFDERAAEVGYRPGDESTPDKIAKVIASFGAKGCTAAELQEELVRRGILSAGGQKAVYRHLAICKAFYGVVQPAERGRYYAQQFLRSAA